MYLVLTISKYIIIYSSNKLYLWLISFANQSGRKRFGFGERFGLVDLNKNITMVSWIITATMHIDSQPEQWETNKRINFKVHIITSLLLIVS